MSADGTAEELLDVGLPQRLIRGGSEGGKGPKRRVEAGIEGRAVTGQGVV